MKFIPAIAATLVLLTAAWLLGFAGNRSVPEPDPREVHRSGFDETADILLDFGVGSHSRSDEVRAGITSHHLPTAVSFIAKFYQGLSEFQNTKGATVVIVGPDHFERCAGTMTTTDQAYSTPFGLVEIDTETQKSLLPEGVRLEASCLEGEHSIGVQTLMIKRFLPEAKIVPIVLSSSTEPHSVEQLAQTLGASQKNLIVVASVDFSHYLTYSAAQKIDAESETMIRELSAEAMGLKHADSPASVGLALLYAKKTSGVSPDVSVSRANSYDFTGKTENTTGYLNVFLSISR